MTCGKREAVMTNSSPWLNVTIIMHSELCFPSMEQYVRQRSRKEAFEQEASAILTPSMPGRVLPPHSLRGR